jgi:hypothetical protein
METQQWTIYVGLNDSDTHKQKLLTEKYVSLLKKRSATTIRWPFPSAL